MANYLVAEDYGLNYTIDEFLNKGAINSLMRLLGRLQKGTTRKSPQMTKKLRTKRNLRK
jgi:hypothetical protein